MPHPYRGERNLIRGIVTEVIETARTVTVQSQKDDLVFGTFWGELREISPREYV